MPQEEEKQEDKKYWHTNQFGDYVELIDIGELESPSYKYKKYDPNKLHNPKECRI